MHSVSKHVRLSELTVQNLNEDRSILSATKMTLINDSVCQYKVCVDIRGGSLERGRQTTMG